MKAIIMAGGNGTRLRPLTHNLPKPMVPLLDRPCMEYIIELLKRHGITEIAVTLQYLAQVIKNHFGDGSEYGVRLTYFEETVPLGTAGSVKNAEDFLDETFLVISGDSLTDYNLSAAIQFHKQKAAKGTLVLTKVDVPLEFGVVVTGEDGKIIRFLEKPSWSEVFSDTVNTGIYVLEPEVLQMVPGRRNFDFSKDLFPLMMENGMPLFGYVAEGYWSDIGNLVQYRQTQFDMLNRMVDVQIKGIETSPGMWIGKDVKVGRGVILERPVFIGDGTFIEAASKIGSHTIIGRYNWIEQGSALERTVIWNRNHIGRASSLSGATICSRIHLGAGTSAGEEVVIGENCRIGDRALIKPGVKIWPGKSIAACTIQQSSVIWGKSVSRNLFGIKGISGIPNLELNPELVGKVSAAYGSCIGCGGKVSVSCDQHPYSIILKYSVISGLLAVGVNVRDIGSTVVPVARFECRSSGSDGAIHIRRTESEGEERILIHFFDRDGLPIAKGTERKIENAFLQEDFVRPDSNSLGKLEHPADCLDSYLREVLSQVDLEKIRAHGYKVVVQCENPQVTSMMQQILEQLGCSILLLCGREAMLELVVAANKADFGIKINGSGQNFSLVTEMGYILSEDELLILKTVVSLKENMPVAIPVTAPSVVEDLTAQAGAPAVRTKTVSRSILEVGKASLLQVHYDAFCSMVSIIEHLAQVERTLHGVVQEFPRFHLSTDVVTCPIEAKGRVMRRLMEEMKGQRLELVDGIKVLTDDAWALIL
ncbi:MAG TPA: sugar phosphate nucleotidyltransferase, partial [Verrucomicrobiae bacterium]|nr:sugar phosphate nucleotidyltransferase [Verrucomicrobiae bacterium]